jgi:hypothetical protein
MSRHAVFVELCIGGTLYRRCKTFGESLELALNDLLEYPSHRAFAAAEWYSANVTKIRMPPTR